MAGIIGNKVIIDTSDANAIEKLCLELISDIKKTGVKEIVKARFEQLNAILKDYAQSSEKISTSVVNAFESSETPLIESLKETTLCILFPKSESVESLEFKELSIAQKKTPELRNCYNSKTDFDKPSAEDANFYSGKAAFEKSITEKELDEIANKELLEIPPELRYEEGFAERFFETSQALAKQIATINKCDAQKMNVELCADLLDQEVGDRYTVRKKSDEEYAIGKQTKVPFTVVYKKEEDEEISKTRIWCDLTYTRIEDRAGKLILFKITGKAWHLNVGNLMYSSMQDLMKAQFESIGAGGYKIMTKLNVTDMTKFVTHKYKLK